MCNRRKNRLRKMLQEGGDYSVNRRTFASWIAILCHHVIIIVAGLIGFIGDPSPTVTTVLGGEVASYLWSGTFVLFGSMALIARLFRRARAEVVAVLSIAGARMLWAGILIGAMMTGISSRGGLQIAATLAAGSFFMLGWSLMVLGWISGWILP